VLTAAFAGARSTLASRPIPPPSPAEAIMDIERALAALLRRRGVRITGAIRAAIGDFAGIVAEENPDRDEDDPDDEDGDQDDELARNQAITCPHCGEPIEVAIDLSSGDQDGISDCSVCCRPIRIRYSVEGGRLGAFSSEPA
jgi:hypothetical protein